MKKEPIDGLNILGKDYFFNSTEIEKTSIKADGLRKYLFLDLNKNIDLFVFSGQSNMMGASAIEPGNFQTQYALEYKYQKRLRGESIGDFVVADNPSGDWIYKNPSVAYDSTNKDVESGKSKLADFTNNTYFVPSLSDGKRAYKTQSEYSNDKAASLPPYFMREYVTYGNRCVYAHMAKGSVTAEYYFNDAMKASYEAKVSAYNAAHSTSISAVYDNKNGGNGANDAFLAKYNAMLEDLPVLKPDFKIKSKVFVWMQGESSVLDNQVTYKLKLEVLWEWLKTLGFTHFFCCRVGYWGSNQILDIMRAQEQFCDEHDDAYMITRAYSYMWWDNNNPTFFIDKNFGDKYKLCRDSFYGYNNYHFNEKGHSVAAEMAAYNAHRILNLGFKPDIEDENVRL